MLKWCFALLSLVSCSSHFNAGSGNLQHSPTGSSGQAAIERPQGITVPPRFSSQVAALLSSDTHAAFREVHKSVYIIITISEHYHSYTGIYQVMSTINV